MATQDGPVVGLTFTDAGGVQRFGDSTTPYPVTATIGGTVTLGAGGNTIGAVTVTSVIPGTTATSLGKAEDAVAANGDVGVMTLGVRGPAVPAASTSAAGDYGAFKTDAEGNQVVKLNAIPDVTYQAVQTLITATSTAAKASAGAGQRNYVTDITVSNSSATPTLVTLLDGATVIWQTWLAAGASIDGAFTTPLRGTAATAINVQSSVAVTSVYVAIAGFTGI